MSTTTPTVAAMRAAKLIVNRVHNETADFPRPLAEIIDRETWLPELIKACQQLMRSFEYQHHKCPDLQRAYSMASDALRKAGAEC